MIHWVKWLEWAFGVFAVAAIWYSVHNFKSIKKILVGRPLRTAELKSQHTKLVWLIALPILSADLYSSVSYGPESGLTELASLGEDAKWLIIPITLATIFLLGILILSYIMGILAYPNGGGAYAIAKDNFKTKWPALIASSALLIDYILTVAVSISAAMEAIVSAYPNVEPYETLLAIGCVLLLVLINLRGVAESARVLAWPTIGFIICMLFIIGTGFIDGFKEGFTKSTTPSIGIIPEGLSTLLLLKAFSSACSALTGIETISNSVPVFRAPQKKNAIKTYIALGIITSITLIGFSFHLFINGISVKPHNTMLSQLTGLYFGNGLIYQVIIWFTFIVLILAANSTFNGFSQLGAIVAADGFLPRALLHRGDRLGYSNGIIVLAACASLLIIGFKAHTNALIPLYAIGVFLSFSIAQFGLIHRWLKVKGTHWHWKLAINTVGAIITTAVAIIFSITKFSGGAWIVLVILPIFVLCSLAIHRHYEEIVVELKLEPGIVPVARKVLSIVLISGVHQVVNHTLSFAKGLNGDVIAVYIGFDDEAIHEMEERWSEWGSPCRLVCLKSKYRSLIEPLARLIKVLEEKQEERMIHILIPQFIPVKWWHNLLHNHSALVLRVWFLQHKDIAVTTVPYHLKK
ncbi:APC family permease [Neobacillus jeddahensis]|uniref:APC family permease n=1 Tax=Neobacillus jeddahensis TaxID=1461580 RepID=UPI0005AA5AE8|nr:APC family permease [Neobacillus jeddahensis]